MRFNFGMGMVSDNAFSVHLESTPNFHDENPVEFRVWCAMAHRQSFVPMYTTCVIMFIQGQAEAYQSIKHVDACHIYGETDVTS